jgi:hypothetical protein
MINTPPPTSEYLLQNAGLSPGGNLAIITVEGKDAPDGVQEIVEASIASARFAV